MPSNPTRRGVSQVEELDASASVADFVAAVSFDERPDFDPQSVQAFADPELVCAKGDDTSLLDDAHDGAFVVFGFFELSFGEGEWAHAVAGSGSGQRELVVGADPVVIVPEDRKRLGARLEVPK